MTSLIKVLACASLALSAFTSFAADAKIDPTGTWTWTTAAGGGDPVVTTLKLKLDGDKLTGKLTPPARNGGAATEVDIQSAKLVGNVITFNFVQDRNGTMRTNKYEGKITADTIKGTVERPARNGGAATPTDWEAKREVAKK